MGLISLEQCFNSLGRLVDETKYGYDHNGNKIFRFVTTDNEPVETRWDYNSLNQITATLEAVGAPEQKTVQRSYDAVGRLKKIVKNDGITQSWSYDALGRKKKIKTADNTISHSFTYDLNDNLLSAKDNITQTSIKCDYDIYNQLISETLPYGHQFKYDYDLIGQVKAVSLPDNTKIYYNRNGDQLQSIARNGNSTYQQTYTAYDKSSNPTIIKLPEEVGELKISYDLLNRNISTNSSLWHENIVYENHLLKQRSLNDGIGENLSSYSYDALDQLLTENGSAEHSFEYDMQRNPVAYDGHYRKFNSCNSILKQGKHRYGYDLNGNRTSDGVNTYVYDALDRLVEASTPKGTYKYFYDAMGRRVASLHENHVKYFIWQKGQEIGSVSQEGIIKELQILDPTNRAIALELQGTVYIPLHDVFGHMRSLLDVNGNCVATYRYSAFGKEQIQGEVLSPWRYAGKRIDAETGLIYVVNRYYDSKTLCWITQDPIGDAGGVNLYAYVNNNPLYYIDPNGCNPILYGFAWVCEFFSVTWGGAATAGAVAGAAGSGTAVGLGTAGAGAIVTVATAETIALSATAAAAGVVLAITVNSIEGAVNGKGETRPKNEDKKNKKPPYDGRDLGEDPSVCPEGFQWRGKGIPGSREGGYFNTETNDSLRPDFHTPGHKPHWDYQNKSNPKEYRLNTDGTWEIKS